MSDTSYSPSQSSFSDQLLCVL